MSVHARSFAGNPEGLVCPVSMRLCNRAALALCYAWLMLECASLPTWFFGSAQYRWSHVLFRLPWFVVALSRG